MVQTSPSMVWAVRSSNLRYAPSASSAARSTSPWVGDRRVSFDLLDFYHRRLSLFGVDSRSYGTVACAAILEQLKPAFESRALKPIPVVRRFSLNDAAQAFAQVNNGSLHGKAVFVL